MPFGCYSDSIAKNTSISIGGNIIQKIQSKNYLGITIDCHLNGKTHINMISKRLRSLIFTFYKLKKCMKAETLRMIYYALFYSICNYGIVAWGRDSDNAMKSLISIQYTILKLIDESFHPLDIRQNFVLNSLCLCFNKFKEEFTHSKSITRNKLLYSSKINKVIYKKCYLYTAINTFHTLPSDLKIWSNPSTLKKKLQS